MDTKQIFSYLELGPLRTIAVNFRLDMMFNGNFRVPLNDRNMPRGG